MTQSMRSKLHRRLAEVGARLTRGSAIVALDPRRHQPPLPVPEGYTRADLLRILSTISIDNSNRGELTGYVGADLERFLYTLDLVPAGDGKLLEIGANPYFTTLLLRQFRPDYQLSLVNYFGGEAHENAQTVVFDGFAGQQDVCRFGYHNVNLERDELPFPDDSYDVVLYCEVLEHLTGDPMRSLLQIKRVLKPGATLVLTTPNAARLENVVAFFEGRNMYDPYSAYGPYGRHNREYVRAELHRLMEHAGFECEVSFTANVHEDIPPQSRQVRALEQALGRVSGRVHDLGQYLITRWRNARPAAEGLPRWLYRSYPEERMAQD